MATILAAPTWVTLTGTAVAGGDPGTTPRSMPTSTRRARLLRELGRACIKQTSPLRAPRSDVGNNPFEQLPDFGDYFAQGSFAGGAGQTCFHRPERDETRFYWSEGTTSRRTAPDPPPTDGRGGCCDQPRPPLARGLR